MDAYLHAKNAYSEVLTLLIDIQSLMDAHAKGVPVRQEDLEHLRALAGFVRYHVARTQHAISRGSEERRAMEGERA